MHIQLPEHCPDAEDMSGERSIYIVNPEKKIFAHYKFPRETYSLLFVYIGFNVLPKNFSLERVRIDSPTAR